MVDYHYQPNSLVTVRFLLIVLCISMIIIQVGQALSDDLLSLSPSSSSVEGDREHQLQRRNPLVAKMLKQILQRGEMQVEPQRIHAALGKFHRSKTVGPLQHHWAELS